MRATKAVVLARGLGTRMRQQADGLTLTAEQHAMADHGLKALVSVGRPLLDYALSSLADAGIEEVCLVIGPEHAAIIQRYRATITPTRLRITTAIQPAPNGTAAAVLAAESFTGPDPFLVVNSDNIYPVSALAALVSLSGPGLIGYAPAALIAESNIPPARIAQFALIDLAPDSSLAKITEKPPAERRAPSAECRAPSAERRVSMNSWRFGPTIFAACRLVTPSPRGELELQDAVTIAIERFGERFEVVPFSGGVLDLSSRADIAEVTERLRGREVVL